MTTIRASTNLLKPIFISALLFLLFTTIATCNADSTLDNGESLGPGGYLQKGYYVFIMQTDCNLVLYEVNRPIWDSKTAGKGSNCRCVMQFDGNLVVYTPQNTAIWSSNTARGLGNYVLILQKDRNVVIYGPAIWSTNTYLPVLNRNGALMSPVVINALNQANSTTNATIKTGV